MVKVWPASRGSAERVVQRRFRNIQIRRPLDALLGNSGQVHPDRQHIDIGRHAGRANRFGPLQVRLGGSQRLLRGFEAFRRQHRAVIRTDDAGDHLHLGPALFLAGHLPREVGRFHRVAGLSGIIEDLVHRQQRLEIVQGVRPVQGADVEILQTELVLGQQRTEDKDRVVAARVKDSE